jgi:orotate phosphoribosyltransferase-like protein
LHILSSLQKKKKGGQTCNPAGGPFSRNFGTSFNTLIIVINGVQNQNNINIWLIGTVQKSCAKARMIG